MNRIPTCVPWRYSFFRCEIDGDVHGGVGNGPLARIVQSRSRRDIRAVAVVDNLDHRVRPGEEALRRVSTWDGRILLWLE